VDEDLEKMTREQLIAEARQLRAGIRKHRDSTGHDLCCHHPALWSLLPERTAPVPTVPSWPEFFRGCLRYRESLDEQLPHAPGSDAPYAPRDRIRGARFGARGLTPAWQDIRGPRVCRG
jgi:hypothetical protein